MTTRLSMLPDKNTEVPSPEEDPGDCHEYDCERSDQDSYLDGISFGSCRQYYQDLPYQYGLTPSSLSWTNDSMSKVQEQETTEATGSETISNQSVGNENVVGNFGVEHERPGSVRLPSPQLSTKKANNDRLAYATPPVKSEKTSEQCLSPDRIIVNVRLRPIDTQNDVRGWEIRNEMNTLVPAGSNQRLNIAGSPLVRPSTSYTFNSIFNEQTMTCQVHEKVTKPMVQSILSGRHATLLAYGPTGSGKTFTMLGSNYRSESPGLIQLTTSDLFHELNRRAAAGDRRKYTVSVQYFEIYNEKIRDLLVEPRSLEELQVREDETGVPTIPAHETVVRCNNDVLDILSQGSERRSTGETSLNERSSRSHAILRLELTCLEENKCMARKSVVNFVDLAGSECTNTAGTTKIRRREGGKINQSLLALSRVVRALSKPESQRPKHIGYRDSKLTRILQPHLSGNACVSILCCISASKKQMDVTKSALKFATCAQDVCVKPLVNESLDERTLLAKLKVELAEAKAELLKLRNQSQNQQSPDATESMSSRDSSKSVSLYIRRLASNDSSEAVLGADMDGEGAFLEPKVFRFFEDKSPLSVNSNCYTDPPVHEITITAQVGEGQNETLLNAEVASEDERRILLLEEKLRATDTLVDSLYEDLRGMKEYNDELRSLNDQLEDQLQDLKVFCEGHGLPCRLGENKTIARQQKSLIRYSSLGCLILYAAGQHHMILVACMFMWLAVEVYLR